VKLDDPAHVRQEYATDAGLAGRIAGYRFAEGPDAREVTFEAVAEAEPHRLLEVGCGQGWLSERLQRELCCEVVAVDQSEHMVELTRARGIRAQVGDAQDLRFADAEFDCAVAAWMLYHVPDVDRALAELERVLRPGGRLVAVTNSREHLREFAELLGVERVEYSFSAENGEEQLRRHFSATEPREAYGWLAFPNRDEAQKYLDHAIVWAGRQLPQFEGPLRVRRAPVVFVAEKRS
jgi:ubiquinone/menaquinone biosynthesis C-methylase UbiE